MIVNFRTCGISRGARKLIRTLTLTKKKKNKIYSDLMSSFIFFFIIIIIDITPTFFKVAKFDFSFDFVFGF